jgi:hypothetical protein
MIIESKFYNNNNKIMTFTNYRQLIRNYNNRQKQFKKDKEWRQLHAIDNLIIIIIIIIIINSYKLNRFNEQLILI